VDGRAALLAIVLAMGCGSGTSGSAPQPEPVQILEPCSGDRCPRCVGGTTGCALGVDHIDGTCCAAGDPLVHLVADGGRTEAVDIEVSGDFAILCGGFGARIKNIAAPGIVPAAAAGERCQHAAFGLRTPGSQLFFLAHHGDSWVETPSLSSWLLHDDGTVLQLASISEPGVLYEGLAFGGTHLFAAAHASGVRVYELAGDGSPTLVASVTEGLGNPWKIALDGDLAFVADNELGVAVIDVSQPGTPTLVGVTPTAGRPVDVAVTEDRVFVAEGGFGVEVFERNGSTLEAMRSIDTRGTAQAVDSNGDVLAVAAWSHVAIYEPDSGVLLASERLRGYPAFEQDLGVAMVDDLVFVAEWEAMHVLRHRPGFVAADLWIDDSQIEVPSDSPATRAVVLHNRGHLPLRIDDIAADNGAFAVQGTSLVVPPGAGDFVELDYTPPGPVGGLSTLTITSNDIDRPNYDLGLVSVDTSKLNVGDPLDDSFAFLDPSGAGQLAGLQGKVVVLAYFALF
jgi:LVIVD repeat